MKTLKVANFHDGSFAIGSQDGNEWVGVCGRWPLAEVILRDATAEQMGLVRELAEVAFPAPNSGGK